MIIGQNKIKAKFKTTNQTWYSIKKFISDPPEPVETLKILKFGWLTDLG